METTKPDGPEYHPCPFCNGSGEDESNYPCTHCYGSGKITSTLYETLKEYGKLPEEKTLDD